MSFYDWNKFWLRIYSLTAVDKGSETLMERCSERSSIIIDLLKNKPNELDLDSKAWMVIYSIFTKLERDHKLNEAESEQVDSVMKLVLKEAHEFSTAARRIDARIFQEQ